MKLISARHWGQTSSRVGVSHQPTAAPAGHTHTHQDGDTHHSPHTKRRFDVVERQSHYSLRRHDDGGCESPPLTNERAMLMLRVRDASARPEMCD